MSDNNVVQIFQNKENVIEFNISTQGLNTATMKVCFCIETGLMNVTFYATHGTDGKWSIVIPPVPFLERTAYNFYIYVVADDYYFEPFRGVVNVITTPEVFVNMNPLKFQPSNMAPVPPLGVVSTNTPVNTSPAPMTISFTEGQKGREKSIATLAAEALKRREKRVLEESVDPLITKRKRNSEAVKRILNKI